MASTIVLGLTSQATSALAAAPAAPAAPAAVAADTQGAGPTVFGSTVQLKPQEHWGPGIDREESLLGRLGVVRIFQNAPQASILQPIGSRSGVLSFRLSPEQVLSGSYDNDFRTFFAAAPTDHVTWWSYFHEADVAYQHGLLPDLVQFREAYTRVAQIARNAGNPMLKNAVILVGYTANPASGLKVADFMPRSDLNDVIAWDNYNGWFTRQGYYGDPRQMIEYDRSASAAVGKPFAVAEFGSQVLGTDYDGRAKWITDFSVAAAAAGAQFVSYYDSDQYGQGAEYRLLDVPSQDAYRAVLSGVGNSKPDAPAGLVVTAGDAGADVAWRPANGNGLTVTGYQLSTQDVSTGVTTTQSLSAGTLSASLTGLTNGRSYAVTVKAANSLGWGPASPVETVVPGTQLTAPDAPAVTAATGSDRTASLSWSAPGNNGGTSITAYTVTATDPAGAVAGTVTVNGDAGSAAVGGLTNGTPYVLRVVATNGKGDSPAATSSPVSPWTAPGAPTAPRAAGGNGSLTATWTPPASNGGVAVKAYRLTVLNAANGTVVTTVTAPGTATTATVPGLVNGKSYAFTVVADNGAAGPASARSNNTLVATVPTAPLTYGYGGGTGDTVISATAWWRTPASNGGAVVTGYRVTTYRYDGATLLSTTVSPLQPANSRILQVNGLVLKGTYKFTVTAVNPVGASAPSPLTALVTAR